MKLKAAVKLLPRFGRFTRHQPRVFVSDSKTAKVHEGAKLGRLKGTGLADILKNGLSQLLADDCMFAAAVRSSTDHLYEETFTAVTQRTSAF